MIQLTKLNGATVMVNPDLIRTVESKPDTLITYVDGVTLLVRESANEVALRFKSFKQSVRETASIKESTQWT